MIETRALFPILDQKLIELLRSLSPEDWTKQTVARQWVVKDVAAHLLDGSLRTISLARDGHQTPPDREIHSYADLVAFLNQFNADWVKAAKRLSPEVLTELLETTGRQYSEIMAKEDMDKDAMFAVSWAGEHTSKNWFHIAREYTEKWHHQQQIREATGRQGIMTPDLFFPFIATLLRGLPHTYRNTDARTGTCIRISIKLGEQSLDRFLTKSEGSWTLTENTDCTPDTTVEIPASTAWKLFTKALSPNEAIDSIVITGDQSLGVISLNMIAVMA